MFPEDEARSAISRRVREAERARSAEAFSQYNERQARKAARKAQPFDWAMVFVPALLLASCALGFVLGPHGLSVSGTLLLIAIVYFTTRKR
jgi:hypothetical protein